MSDGADCLMHKVNVFGVEKPFYVPRFHFPRLSDQKMCLAQPVTTELHTSAKHHGALTGFSSFLVNLFELSMSKHTQTVWHTHRTTE